MIKSTLQKISKVIESNQNKSNFKYSSNQIHSEVNEIKPRESFRCRKRNSGEFTRGMERSMDKVYGALWVYRPLKRIAREETHPGVGVE